MKKIFFLIFIFFNIFTKCEGQYQSFFLHELTSDNYQIKKDSLIPINGFSFTEMQGRGLSANVIINDNEGNKVLTITENHLFDKWGNCKSINTPLISNSNNDPRQITFLNFRNGSTQFIHYYCITNGVPEPPKVYLSKVYLTKSNEIDFVRLNFKLDKFANHGIIGFQRVNLDTYQCISQIKDTLYLSIFTETNQTITDTFVIPQSPEIQLLKNQTGLIFDSYTEAISFSHFGDKFIIRSDVLVSKPSTFLSKNLIFRESSNIEYGIDKIHHKFSNALNTLKYWNSTSPYDSIKTYYFSYSSNDSQIYCIRSVKGFNKKIRFELVSIVGNKPQVLYTFNSPIIPNSSQQYEPEFQSIENQNGDWIFAVLETTIVNKLVNYNIILKAVDINNNISTLCKTKRSPTISGIPDYSPLLSQRISNHIYNYLNFSYKIEYTCSDTNTFVHADIIPNKYLSFHDFNYILTDLSTNNSIQSKSPILKINHNGKYQLEILGFSKNGYSEKWQAIITVDSIGINKGPKIANSLLQSVSYDLNNKLHISWSNNCKKCNYALYENNILHHNTPLTQYISDKSPQNNIYFIQTYNECNEFIGKSNELESMTISLKSLDEISGEINLQKQNQLTCYQNINLEKRLKNDSTFTFLRNIGISNFETYDTIKNLEQNYSQDYRFSFTNCQNQKCYSNWIKVTFDPQIYIPNAITVNGDQLNDCFRIVGVQLENYQYTIFNRWGEKIYHQDNATQSWCPNPNLPAGNYVIQIFSLTSNKTFKGIITVLK
jgi:gliding motility-associated-like protein